MAPQSVDRIKKIDSLLLETLSDIVRREVKDPTAGIFSLTQVRTSRDLKYSKVMVSVLGEDETRNHTIQILNKLAGYFRHLLNDNVHLRTIPQLTFILDTSVDYSQKIEALIRQTKEKPVPDHEA
ncbi:MAG: 30S ribosome-binding factor RbfA [Candidatus Delongbacteria bacterium]|nr:30S ribosome-binding factor RbfA [Candidatus Delongbacteria bacterium]